MTIKEKAHSNTGAISTRELKDIVDELDDGTVISITFEKGKSNDKK